MAVLEWDKAGERFYETGLDRGVLYTRTGEAFVWNGLTNVTENTERDVKSFWMDGVKYLDHHVPGAYSAKLEAFTYPDILEELTGTMRYSPGVFFHDQPSKVFHLSYRTGIGNDVSQDQGYKLHIIYNVMAVPSSTAMGTIGDNVEPGAFSWDLKGTPPTMFGARPTSHIHLDSRFVSPELLQSVEDGLYGTEVDDPILFPMADFKTLLDTLAPPPDPPPDEEVIIG